MTHTCRHDDQGLGRQESVASVGQRMRFSARRAHPARFEDLRSEVLAKVVSPGLIAHEQQAIRQFPNPLAISAEDVVVGVDAHHTSFRTTKYHAALYVPGPARDCT